MDLVDNMDTFKFLEIIWCIQPTMTGTTSPGPQKR